MGGFPYAISLCLDAHRPFLYPCVSAEAVAQSDLVVEAIIESMKIKNELFAFIDKKAKSSCIFASNTSSLSIAEIGSPVSEERKRKFGGLHFFNPVPAMKLVEIIRTPHTDDATIDTLTQVTLAMKKVPVHCKDTPGFIVNRLLMPYLLESVRMMERGEATAEDIDKAMELGAGYPMGPFKLLDFIGLDTTAHISGGWRAKAEEGLISKEIVAPVPTIEKLIKEGKFGRKSGHGFYDVSRERRSEVETSVADQDVFSSSLDSTHPNCRLVVEWRSCVALKSNLFESWPILLLSLVLPPTRPPSSNFARDFGRSPEISARAIR